MISAGEFLGYLKEKGFTFFSGVPCSILKPILNRVLADRDIRYISAVREDAALGLASGAYLAGAKGAILIQNSGLGNIINALTSFSLIYKVPILILISWRGYRGKDAPEHIIMGQRTLPLLRGLSIPTVVLGPSFKKEIDWALGQMDKRLIPVAAILKKGSVG